MKPLSASLLCLAGVSLAFWFYHPIRSASAQMSLSEFLSKIDGKAVLIANDGKYLGVLSSSQKAKDSICNPNSPFGSDYGLNSIRNQHGLYGSDYGLNSPWNSNSIQPPFIVVNGKKLAHVTTNRNIINRLPFPPIPPAAILSGYGCL